MSAALHDQDESPQPAGNRAQTETGLGEVSCVGTHGRGTRRSQTRDLTFQVLSLLLVA